MAPSEEDCGILESGGEVGGRVDSRRERTLCGRRLLPLGSSVRVLASTIGTEGEENVRTALAVATARRADELRLCRRRRRR